MRVISGKLKGRKIEPPEGLGIRPTTDRAREALFNILANKIDFNEINVLDLFGGSGVVTVEFASRGAETVVCIEKNAKIAAYLKNLFKGFGLTGCSTVNADATTYIRTVQEKFDIIFMDPPYQANYQIELLSFIFTRELLTANGWAILEHESSDNFENLPFFVEKRTYSRSSFSFFRYAESMEGNERATEDANAV